MMLLYLKVDGIEMEKGRGKFLIQLQAATPR